MNQLPALFMMIARSFGVTLAGWAIVSSMIWLLFPLVPALQSPGRRLLAILVALMVCLAISGIQAWRKRRRQRALDKAMTGEDGHDARDSQAAAAEEVAQLKERMKQALARVKKGRRGRHLYEQPWYVLIGPPGSGKTTALQNSGLHFPLDGDAGGGPVRGVGGTRLCDWWFADEAVLIDTAGRYTTQDSDAVVDRAGWQGFLDLLRRTRPREPINGVIVVLSLVELASADRTERLAHARSVRLRINEITERLHLRVPVYVMLSKADQVRGFDAYFDDLDTDGRAQVWGMTFPIDKGVALFTEEYRLLLGRLADRQVERLQAERATERRALIGSFPLQMASLEAPLTEFLNQAFSGSKLDPAPFLRGVYMTSATQQGTPIDRLTGLLAQTFGVDQKGVPSLRPVSGREYFISRLLSEVVLNEAVLASQRPERIRRRKVLRAVGFSAIGVAATAAGLLLWRVAVENRVAIEQANEGAAAYRQQLAGLKLDPVADDDFAKAGPVLDAAAGLRHVTVGWTPVLYGLSQQAKLEQVSQLDYERALQRIMLPRLLWRLEQQMRSHLGDPSYLYEATRVYLMLGDMGPLDPGLVRAWMEADWTARYPGALNAELRGRLQSHLAALMAEPLPEATLDGALVESARATFSRVPLAERVYGRIRIGATAQAAPGWAPSSALGAVGGQLFARKSGKPLTEEIPGLYTRAGLQGAVLHDLPATTRAAAGESWVLGHAEQIPTEGPQIVALEQAVLSLYFADAQARWDTLLGDLVLKSGGGRGMTIQDLYVLSSPQSPLRDLLTAIVRVLPLGNEADKQPAKAGAPATLPPAEPSSGTPAPPAALQAFRAHFKPLVDLLGSSSGVPPLDNVLRLVNSLQQELAALAPGAAAIPGTLQSAGQPAQLLLAEAERQPAPLAGWLRQVATSGSAMLGTATHASAAAAFSSGDGPQALCRNVVEGRFPFSPRSSKDAPIDDFARLFAPGGVLDKYFEAQIKPFVDRRGPVWRAQALGGVAAPVDAASLASFQRAATIRDALFPSGGPPQIHFTVTPRPGEMATLTLGAASVGTDAEQTVSFSWPGADGAGTATVQFGKTPDDGPAIKASGPWALFRLLAQARVSAARGTGTSEAVFEDGEHRAAFTLQAGSSSTPVQSSLLAGFTCPMIR